MEEKIMQIFKEGNDYVIRRIDEFGTSYERRYDMDELNDILGVFKKLGELDKYKIQIEDVQLLSALSENEVL